ncbi:uncharacterized protein [Elaeis guineensis]|uniref:Uncharacterized protein LOC105048323 isoform X2 n=1 Tax=Elaeis guineensis var. tenera TaxID=51953 RepID=A0A8N4EYH3_ELAGV|nr:uncharacterized protein LOC105048323 isoform X2 [Elaeis guineensis]
MIASRSLTRVDRLWKVVSAPAALSNPLCRLQVPTIQGYARDHNINCVMKMGGTNGGPNVMDRRKKQNAIMPIWRPISTQSVDYSERSNVPYEVQEVYNNVSSCVADIQNVTQDEPNSEDAPGRHTCETDSKSNEAICQKEVKEKTLQELSSNKDAESGCGVEKHLISVEVDASLIRFIKGKGGSVQRQIEGDMGVKIAFPASKEDSSIVIEGNSIESVTKASKKIASIVEEAVKSPQLDYSHFISLPLAIHPELVEKLTRFQNSILGDSASRQDDNLESASDEDASEDEQKQLESPSVAVKLEVQDEKEPVRVKIDSNSAAKTSILSDLGIDRSIFIKPRTFHLTVLMLKLWNKDRVAAASEVLQRISSKVNDALGNRPVSIRLKGLTCMKGSLAKARVVYTPVVEIGGEGRLLRACQVIIDSYVEAGLVLENDAHQTLKGSLLGAMVKGLS